MRAPFISQLVIATKSVLAITPPQLLRPGSRTVSGRVTRAHWLTKRPVGLDMRPRRLLVDRLGAEYGKIENDIAIANALDVDQSPSMASLTRTASATRKEMDVSGSDEQANVVLVHDAWADWSTSNDVIGPLLSGGSVFSRPRFH